MILVAIIHDAEEGGFWAEVPALPGCFTEGDTPEEVRLNLKEAISGIFGSEADSISNFTTKDGESKVETDVVPSSLSGS